MVLSTDFADALLQELLAQFKGREYTVVYATSPRAHMEDISSGPFEAGSQEVLMQGKRSSNDTQTERVPLFAKYQFFTPGKQMHLFA